MFLNKKRNYEYVYRLMQRGNIREMGLPDGARFGRLEKKGTESTSEAVNFGQVKELFDL